MNKSSLSFGVGARMIYHLLFIHYTLIYKSCPMSERKYLSVK